MRYLLVLLFVFGFSYADVSIVRTYQSSKGYLRVVIKTDKTMEIKCSAIDENGDPLSVDSQWISAPVDEFLLRVPESLISQAKGVKCYH